MARTVRPDPRVDPATLPPPPPAPASESTLSDAGSVSQFRHKIAALQAQVADVQRLLADEQRERAEEADELARMLKALALAERRLAEERDVAQQLAQSLTQREEECITLRGHLQDAEQRLEDLASTKEQLVAARASEGELKRQLLDSIAEVDALQSAKTELTHAKKVRDETQKDAAEKAQEIERLGAQLKQAHMKAFTANKQLESWKVESQRAMDQLRKEYEERIDALTKKVDAHDKDQRELRAEAAAARSMRQHIDASIKILGLTSEALEAVEVAEAEIQKLRATHDEKRRKVLEQALGVRNALKRASEEGPTVEVSEADWDADDETK